MAGYAINYLTPTAALGGEVTKGVLLAQHSRGAEATSGVLIGKLCFALAHLLFVALGVIVVLWRLPLPKPLWFAMLGCGALMAVCMMTFMLLQKHGKLGALVRWLAARKATRGRLNGLARELTAVDDTMSRFHRERPADLRLAIAWHLLGYSIGIAQTYLFFRLLHYNCGLAVAAGTWFLGMWFDLLTFAVPLNLGTLEGTRIVALQALGYSAVTGMTYGFALRLAQIFWACFGLGSYALITSPPTGAALIDPDKSSPAQHSASTARSEPQGQWTADSTRLPKPIRKEPQPLLNRR
jgi:hypothetical protein